MLVEISLIKKNFLIILVGLPSSGKSVFANKLKSILNERYTNFKIKMIDPDEIRNTITLDKFDYNLEQEVRTENLKSVKNALKKGFIVISDDLNYYTSMRHDLKKIADKLGLKYFIIHISTPLETCIKWNKNRGKTIPTRVVINISKKFDDFGKYKWDVPLANYDLSQLKDLNEPIEKLINIFIRNLKISEDLTKTNEFLRLSSNINNEKLDKITRNIAGDLIRNPKFSLLKNKIIKNRKIYVKKNLNTDLTESEIIKKFKGYLEKSLNIRIS